MENSELNSILVDYVKTNLSPTSAERAIISKRYNQLKDFLQERAFQSGSYARHTSTTPVNDLDVIYELPKEVIKTAELTEAVIIPARLDIHSIIESLSREIEVFYGSSATIKQQLHSVGVYFGTEDDFSIDIVPALPTSHQMYWVPELAHLSISNRRITYAEKSMPPSPNWIKSDPRGYIAQASEVDQNTSGKFRKTIKAIKRWRLRCKKENNQFPLKSFHIEQIIINLFLKDNELNCLDAIQIFINQLHNYIEKPQFRDKADRSRFIDQYITSFTETENKLVLDCKIIAQKEIANFLKAESKSEALTLLDSFLGRKLIEASTPPITQVLSKATTPSQRHILRGLYPIAGREADEQFLSDFDIGTKLIYNVKINAKVDMPGFRPFRLLYSKFLLVKKGKLDFYIESCDVPKPYAVKWKVKNTGADAKGDLRGQIYDDKGRERWNENTKYWGNHYVECYMIKDGICVAADHIDVDIGKN